LCRTYAPEDKEHTHSPHAPLEEHTLSLINSTDPLRFVCAQQ
jgi:hypothetical protein